MNDASATVLIAGCGDLGGELGRQLIAKGHTVIGLRRSDQPLPYGISTVQADVRQAATLRHLASLNPEILVYSVAADAASDDSYHAHYVHGLRNVLHALEPCKTLRHVFFVSSTRVYGQNSPRHGDAIIDETTAAVPDDFGGERLLEAEALLAAFPGNGTVLRLSGIYGPGRTRMLRLAAQAAAWPPVNAWTNRIHRDDAASFIASLIARVLAHAAVQDCYIVSDSEPAPQYAVLMWLAQQLGIDTDAVTAPPVSGGKRLSNARMLQTGFQPAYADYRVGYLSLIEDTHAQTKT